LLEFVVRIATPPIEIRAFSPAQVSVVGGRLLGRFWYNPAFGGR